MIRPDRKTEPSSPLTARKLGAGDVVESPSRKKKKNSGLNQVSSPAGKARSEVSNSRHVTFDGGASEAFDQKSSMGGLVEKKPTQRQRGEKRPARKMTEQRVRNIAEHYVASRECTRQMLREVLMRRSREISPEEAEKEAVEAESLIEAEIERLVKAGLIDDARYAEGRARADLNRGRGARRILMDLSQKGVDKEVAEDALKEAARDVTGTLGRDDVDDDEVSRNAEWEAADTFARKKRFGPYRSGSLPDEREAAQKIWRREASSMARQGFGLDLIRQIIDREPEDDII
jgi:regulatory protein